MSFAHLHVRTGYSFFQSMIQIDPLVEQANKLNMSALALTDDRVLYGVIPFYKACLKHGIKPIIGLHVHVTIHEDLVPCTLLAKTNLGYEHIMKISTHLQMEDDLTEAVLKSLSDDVVCIISSQYEPFKRELLVGESRHLTGVLARFNELFHVDDVYVSVEYYDEADEVVLETLREHKKQWQNKLVALQDVRYLNEKDNISFDCLQAMKRNEIWDGKAIEHQSKGRHLKSLQEMKVDFASVPESIETINEIVEKCHVTFDFDHLLLPTFPVPEDLSATDYLRKQCESHLEEKYEHVTEEVLERLNDEIAIIDELGFSNYFLIVADFVRFAKEQDILVGPGRGSAAGSIVSYLLGITNVDPLKHELLFERFLNPERVSMPDIDIDFSDRRREEVIQYVQEKYGQDYVAQIITFDTFGARSLLRELMKTMAINEHDQAYVLEQIPRNTNDSLKTYLKQSTDFAAYVKQSPSLRLLFLHAVKLEGLPRHMSTHAAGIVLGPDPLIKHVPLTKGSHDVLLTQYAMNELEAIGLLKIDILGLRNLTMMERIVDAIERTTGKSINIDELPENDEKTFALLRAGRTNGIFQLESDGMKRVLVNLKPTSLDDIIALNALYRPGPMEQIPTYIERKHGKPFNYIHPSVQPILEKTYGVLVYQEQIMQIAHIVAGFSLGEADLLRRAVSQKKRDLLIEQKQAFLDGARRNGYDVQVTQEIFSWIMRFADYGFNKSHSVAYSKIAYQLSYLKANYPAHFFAPLLSSVRNEPGKLTAYIKEATDLGLDVLPPSINRSFGMYTVEKGHLRTGLMSIKGIGYETVKKIIDERREKKFTDLFDFCIRVSLRRNVLETLILAGTFDETYDNRASLLASIDQAVDRAQLFGQDTLFRDALNMKPSYVAIDDFTIMQKLQDEKELLHRYVSSHPLKQYRTQLDANHFVTLQKVKTLDERQPVKSAAIIQAIRKIHTKRGESMAFSTVADETGEIDVVIFPNVYRDVHPILQTEQIVQLEGKLSIRRQEKQIIVDVLQLLELDNLLEANERLFIRLLPDDYEQALSHLKELAHAYPGSIPLIIYDVEQRKTYQLGRQYNLQKNTQVYETLAEIFGKENVVFK